MRNEELLRQITLRFQAVAEGMTDQVRAVAEGHSMLAEKLDALAVRMRKVESGVERLNVGGAVLRAEMRKGHAALREEMRNGDAALREEMHNGDAALRGEMRAGDQALQQELSAFREEVRGEFAEVRRVARLETTVSDLAGRVTRLEDRTGT